MKAWFGFGLSMGGYRRGRVGERRRVHEEEEEEEEEEWLV